MAAAVSGLSPVIITVRMPIARSSSKRSRMPGFTVSFSRITPSTRHCPPGWRSITTSGVAPSLETCSHDRAAAPAARVPPSASTKRRTESAAPLRTVRPSVRSMPDMRVCAVNGTSTAPGSSMHRQAELAHRQLHDRPALGRLVGERRHQRAPRPPRSTVTSCTGMNSAAWREP